MEERKQKEIEFHNKLRAHILKQDKSKYDYLTSNRKFHSAIHSGRAFVNEWLLQRCPDRKVLDYCCGDGGVSVFLAKNGAEDTGIDISGESINNAQNSAICERVDRNTPFLIMDAENLDLENKYFDAVVCSSVLHHPDVRRAYSELARVLKSSGETICIELLAYNTIIQLYRKMTPHLQTEMGGSAYFD